MMKRTLPVSTYFFLIASKVVLWKWAQCGQVIDMYSTIVTGASCLAERHFRQGTGLQHFRHVDVAIGLRDFGRCIGCSGDREGRSRGGHCRKEAGVSSVAFQRSAWVPLIKSDG